MSVNFPWKDIRRATNERSSRSNDYLVVVKRENQMINFIDL